MKLWLWLSACHSINHPALQCYEGAHHKSQRCCTVWLHCDTSCPCPPSAHTDEDSSLSASEASGGVVQLLAPPDGSVWVAHKCGTVDRYTAAGRRLGSAECGAALTAAACVGQRVWLGFSDGMIR